MRIFLLILLLISSSALAAEQNAAAPSESPASCNEQSAGTLKCMESRLCECKFLRGGSITGGTTGYKWDCGINRPSCGEQFEKIEIEPKKYDGPSSVNIDKSSINIKP